MSTEKKIVSVHCPDCNDIWDHFQEESNNRKRSIDCQCVKCSIQTEHMKKRKNNKKNLYINRVQVHCKGCNKQWNHDWKTNFKFLNIPDIVYCNCHSCSNLKYSFIYSLKYNKEFNKQVPCFNNSIFRNQNIFQVNRIEKIFIVCHIKYTRYHSDLSKNRVLTIYEKYIFPIFNSISIESDFDSEGKYIGEPYKVYNYRYLFTAGDYDDRGFWNEFDMNCFLI